MIGVNTAIVSPGSGTFAGVGFAIPSNTVRRIVNQIIKHGKIVKPRIGVFCATDAQSQALLRGTKGVLVVGVEKGSPAEAAGIKFVQFIEIWSNPCCRGVERMEAGIVVNDIVLAVGGKAVTSVEELISIIEEFDIGDLVPITVQRFASDGTPHRVDVNIRTY